MEMIEAVIKPQRLDAVLAALAKIGVLGLTAFEVKGFGTQAGHTERYRGAKMDVGFVPVKFWSAKRRSLYQSSRRPMLPPLVMSVPCLR